MILYLVAIVFATATVFAGIPTACNNGNREHLLNGREPNAGVAFAPDLIVAIILWCVGAKLSNHYFGGAIALWSVIGCGSLILFLTIRRARISTREYHQFIDENGFRDSVERQKQKAQQAVHGNTH
jgi:hypothetical protein